MRKIYLIEVHGENGIYYEWHLVSDHHFWWRAIGRGTFYKMWDALACRSQAFRCYPGVKIGVAGGLTIFTTEFVM